MLVRSDFIDIELTDSFTLSTCKFSFVVALAVDNFGRHFAISSPTCFYAQGISTSCQKTKYPHNIFNPKTSTALRLSELAHRKCGYFNFYRIIIHFTFTAILLQITLYCI